jgi:hydrogenase maturation protein HypF
MRITASGFERIAHLRRFRLPGGEAAIREPWRCALGVRFAIGGEAAFGPEHPPAFRQMLRGGVNSPLTSSAGRLFDAVAALLGLCRRASFEGQAAMELEHALAPGVEDAYPIGAGAVIDWEPTIEALLDDDSSVGVRAARFHNALVEAIVGVACLAGEARVVLTGGCFQNRYLTERAVGRLREAGFRPYWHQRVPPNDGGIAIGQLAAAVRTIRMSRGASDQREMSAQAEGLHR